MSIVITFKGIAKYFHNFLNSMKFFFCAEVIHNYSKLPCNAVLLHTPMVGNQENFYYYVYLQNIVSKKVYREIYIIVMLSVSYNDFSLPMYAKLKYQHQFHKYKYYQCFLSSYSNAMIYNWFQIVLHISLVLNIMKSLQSHNLYIHPNLDDDFAFVIEYQ